MGDVNFMLWSRIKIEILLSKLEELDRECQYLNDILANTNLSQDDEIYTLTILTKLYDVRLWCLARLNMLMNSRFMVFLEH